MSFYPLQTRTFLALKCSENTLKGSSGSQSEQKKTATKQAEGDRTENSVIFLKTPASLKSSSWKFLPYLKTFEKDRTAAQRDERAWDVGTWVVVYPASVGNP